jgi:trehalose 6-phosphate phosphatase
MRDTASDRRNDSGSFLERAAPAHLEDALAAVLQVLQAAPSALITDIDGTISRIAPRPEDAVVSPQVRSALTALVPRLALTAVVTAREATVARDMVGVQGIEYIGNYALDGPATRAISGDELASVMHEIEATAKGLPGVLVEDKGVSVALHYRACPDSEAARTTLLTFAEPIAARCGARIVEGKQVIELVPAALPDKGTAVRNLLEERGIDGVVYFGDDISDIPVFRELATLRKGQGYHTLTIAVVDTETYELVPETADITIAGVGDVETLLTALAARLSEDEQS